MKNYLYLISQDKNCGYDVYDSAIVCAESEEEAKNAEVGDTGEWVVPEYVKVQLIGVADKHYRKALCLVHLMQVKFLRRG